MVFAPQGQYISRAKRDVICGIFPLVAFAALLSLAPAAPGADHLDPETGQLIVGIAPSWDSMHGKLWRLDRHGSDWQSAGAPVPVLFGKHGLAWGRGEIEGNSGPIKVERDGRAPAGIFRLGTIYTYDESLPAGATYPYYHTVGAGDAWVDDVNNPNYNRHVVVVDPDRAPP